MHADTEMKQEIAVFASIVILSFSLFGTSLSASHSISEGLLQSAKISPVGRHSLGSSAPPATEWNRRFGPHIQPNCVVETDDGGFALAGRLAGDAGYGAGNDDFWLAKTDVVGHMEWNRTYGGANSDSAYSVVQTSDGGYAIAGDKCMPIPPWQHDFWLVKTDSSGNHLWNRTYGGARSESVFSMIETADGSFVVAGHTSSFPEGDSNAWVVKVGGRGKELWSRTYGGTDADSAYSVQQSDDGGYGIAGHTSSFGLGGAWLVKIDADGGVQWNQTYGGGSAMSVVQTSDGGYAIAGGTRLIKTDATGGVEWSKTYDWLSAQSVVQTDDQGYIVASDDWLVKTDQEGNVQWRQLYGGYACRHVIPTADGGYATAGYRGEMGLSWGRLIKIAPEQPSGTVYLRSDGAIDPVTAPIATIDSSTYTLIGSITSTAHGIVVERDNIVLDGAGYSIHGAENGIGIYLEHRRNVTIKNTDVSGFYYGIYLWDSSNNTLHANDISVNKVYGLYIRNSFDNSISENSVTTNHDCGIWLDKSVNITVSGNNMTANYGPGITLTHSTNNIVFGNSIADNRIGIWADRTSGNKFYHNNLINNTNQVYTTPGCADAWDNGFTIGGNYWSDRAGEDAYSGPYQNETCRDGIVDTAYTINETLLDRYPLMDPWSTHLNPPVPRFGFSPDLPQAREAMSFDASSSYDVNEDIVSYRWDFDDGNTSWTTDSAIDHTYEFPGFYNVTLTAVDSGGLNCSYSQTVFVRMITSISISTSSKASFVGFAVNVTGSLRDIYGTGLRNETVILYYAFSGVSTWTPITSDITDSLGNYHAVWIPPATGSFIVKAEWTGNSTYVGAHNVTNLDILTYEEEYVFSVESNSTISSLAFNPSNLKLSFTISGALGTPGYVRVTVEILPSKNLLLFLFLSDSRRVVGELQGLLGSGRWRCPRISMLQ